MNRDEPFNQLHLTDTTNSGHHALLLEKVLPEEEDGVYPCCLDGAYACPPEDCGGVWGYEQFVTSIQNPKHPDHQRNLEWVGGAFAPETFDVDHITQQFAEGIYWDGELVAALLISRNTFTNYDAE